LSSSFLFPNGRLVSLTHGEPLETYKSSDESEERALIEHLRNGTIGRSGVFKSPFGQMPMRYFDFTASGQFHSDIEDELNQNALPFMANTHSETSHSAKLMNEYYHGAFARIAHYVKANDDDILIPVGYGSTGAINRLIHILGLRQPVWQAMPKTERKPLVIRSKMEHHSNDIAWRETIADTLFTEFTAEGTVDLDNLESLLKTHAGTRKIYGTFSAASNVTGIRNDVDNIARILHKYGVLAFFDYAAAAPHAEIVVRNSDDEESRKDALFISTHKMIGGPRTPGLLVAHKSLFQNSVPAEPGGGTVLYTSPWDHQYLPDIFSRETGGTPPVMQSIQAGLVFDLKQRIGCKRIERIEQAYLKRALDHWRDNPNLMLLGNLDTPRHAMISLVFKGLHHEFAVTLLNDLYGIQVRGGCMCAGTYGHELLAIDQMHSDFITKTILEKGRNAGKPGWVRISIGATVSEEEFVTLLDAVDFISREGKKYESKYEYIEANNSWKWKG